MSYSISPPTILNFSHAVVAGGFGCVDQWLHHGSDSLIFLLVLVAGKGSHMNKEFCRFKKIIFADIIGYTTLFTSIILYILYMFTFIV